jgi:hypothetical protein
MLRRSHLPRSLQKIERRLSAALIPVQPPADFVEGLGYRLQQEMVRKQKSRKVKTGLLVAGGLVSLIVMVVTLIRTLVNSPKVIQSISKNIDKLRKREQPVSA